MIYYNQAGDFVDAPDKDIPIEPIREEMIGWAINIDNAADNDVQTFLALFKKLSPFPLFRNKPLGEKLFYKQTLGQRIATNQPLVKAIWETGSLAATGGTMKLNVHIMLTDGTREEFSGDDIDKVHKETDEYLQSL